jgi:hypothetical protein
MRTTHLVAAIAIPMMTAFFWGCSTTEMSSRSTDDGIVPSPPVSPLPQLPAGWQIARLTDSVSGIRKAIISSDSSAMMLLRELFVLKDARPTLDAERIGAIGQLSLKRTMAAASSTRRVLRLPESLGRNNEYCSYVFEDGALLRRIVVFRVRGRYYELELRQLKEGRVFGTMTADQLEAAQILPDLP